MNLNDAQAQPEDQGTITIKFSELGSSQFGTYFGNVTPLQLLEVAAYLKVLGERALNKSMDDAEKPRIEMAGPDISQLFTKR